MGSAERNGLRLLNRNDVAASVDDGSANLRALRLTFGPLSPSLVVQLDRLGLRCSWEDLVEAQSKTDETSVLQVEGLIDDEAATRAQRRIAERLFAACGVNGRTVKRETTWPVVGERSLWTVAMARADELDRIIGEETE